ncbi:DHHC palmitoyltransferase-domain-containing protein [Globomyces pollinis-pini]|nr:DHHC palmitoyltransferase-domain-containing protein [Globomyces pollinis-pini]
MNNDDERESPNAILQVDTNYRPLQIQQLSPHIPTPISSNYDEFERLLTTPSRTNGFTLPLPFQQIFTFFFFIVTTVSNSILIFPFFESIPLKITLYITFYIYLIITLYTGFLVMKSDPGEFKNTLVSNYNEVTEEPFCQVCKVFIHVDALHCKYCNKCIRKLDHHCFYVNNCIGFYNYRIYLDCLRLACVYSLITLILPIILISVNRDLTEMTAKYYGFGPYTWFILIGAQFALSLVVAGFLIYLNCLHLILCNTVGLIF